MRQQFTLFIFLMITFCGFAQETKVLFVGNSYTNRNNLRQLFRMAAESTGETVLVEKQTAGGARLSTHANSIASLDRINSRDWDYVVLQAQSQEPSFPDWQVAQQTYPYAASLCEVIRENNACTRPVFFMTWGRENGDDGNCANWPPVCTYEGMDSLLNLRYRIMADDNEGYVSPVGEVWRYIRTNYPDIGLYAGDGSHPSLQGSYAAACTFYAILLQKDPTLITFNSELDAQTADLIKQAAKVVAYDQLEEWNIGDYAPQANFSTSTIGNTVSFTNMSLFADTVFWDFGDGTTSNEENPIHLFELGDNYMVQLVASTCGKSDTLSMDLDFLGTHTTDVLALEVELSPNPAQSVVRLSGVPEGSSFVIVNMQGQEVSPQKKLEGNQVDVEYLPKGMYVIRWIGGHDLPLRPLSFIKN